MFSKILIANRGEIALRIIRSCKEMGIKTVAVYSTADINSLHVRMADESVCIGGPRSSDSYLKMESILSAADITGAEAIHPGVGFLSENAIFASMVEEHGLVFIGPSARHIKLMGDKISAKEIMEEFEVPLIPGSKSKITSTEQALEIGESFGYPLIVKAASGGGGKGMKIARNPQALSEAIKIAKLEAKMNFGDDSVFLERYLEKPRHIEIQVLADKFGNVITLGERDCSIQRNHQKIWEEAPSPCLTEVQRNELSDIVRNAIRKMGYLGLGTLEFLFEDGKFYFMEMNTRIQVEHPITEMITGIDLVKYQIRCAYGEVLDIKQEDVILRGHAIECRINAENPETFAPSSRLAVSFYHPPGGMGVRVDSHLYHGYEIPPYYDSLVAKLIIYGKDRDECMIILKRALQEYVIDGVETLLPLHEQLVRNADIKKGNYDINWLERNLHGDIKQKST